MVNPLLQELKQQKTAGKNPRRNTKPCKMKGWIEAMQEELASVQATNVKGGNIMIGMSYVFDCIKTTLKFADLSLYSDYAGDNMIEKQHLVDVNILEADWFLGSARKQINCIYLITEQICSSCRDVVDRFLWMQNHSLNYEQSTFETHASFSSRIGYDQRLINVVKEHTDDNVADLLTKGFDLARFNSLIMAIMNSCNKHNMIACVEKTERNTDFHDVIDFLTGCSVNYALLVSPDVIQQWIQQFWNTAKERMINEVAHIEAKVAGKKILVSEASVRTDLMFNDEDGTNCFDNQVIWDILRDIGYEGNLTLLSFSKPLLSPQWKYLVHTLLHCLSSKSSSWDQFATNIASALVGLATNQKFNFSKLIFDGMLRNLKDSKPFLMYPRFIQLFLNKQLEGSTKPQTFLPTVVLPPKVFTFMRKCSPKFSGKLTPLTPPMLEVATAVRAEHALHTEELDILPSSHHNDDSSARKKAESSSPVASERSASPNDYTPTDEQTAKQAAQILRLKTKVKILVKKVKTVKVFDGSTGLNEDDVSGVSQKMDIDDTIPTEVHEGTAQVNKGTAEVHKGTAEVNESTAGANLNTEPSMKEVEDEAGPSTFQDESDEFIQNDTSIADILVNITRSRRGAGITIPGNIPEQERTESPTLILDPKDKGKGIMKEEPKKKKLTLQQLRAAETANDEEVARKVAAEWEEEEERKRLAGLERLQAELEDYEMIAAEVQRTERENFTEEQKAKFLVETIAAQRRFRAEQQAALRRSKPPTISQLRNQMMKYIRNVGENEQAIKEMNVKAEEPSKKRKGTIRKMKSSRRIKKRKIQKSDDELKNFLKVVDFEGDSAQYVEVMKQRSSISRFSIVQSPEGEYIDVQRANGHIRAFNTLNGSLHYIGTVQDLHNLHRLVIEYYEHIPPTGLGLILHGDLTTMMETTEESDDELWRNQTEWEIIKWRLYESTGVHILELENGTMIHMLVEQRYPLTRELMQRMLEHKLEVQNETENALNVIRFVMKQKEDLEREEE
ncbi:hypothetical protein Tco_0499195 [Tanacetum coccineum]